MGQDWWKQDIECMVQPGYPSGSVDHSRILEVNQWSQSAFDAARHSTDKFLCPEVIQLKLTEIRMELYDNSGTTHQSKFIELYNYGSSPIDLSQDTLKFNGFMTSNSFGTATDGSLFMIIIIHLIYLNVQIVIVHYLVHHNNVMKHYIFHVIIHYLQIIVVNVHGVLLILMMYGVNKYWIMLVCYADLNI